MTQSRATLINSWSGGEEVALFWSGDEEAYLFTIDADCSMSGAEFIVDREEEFTYTAFYPYNSEFTTIEEYEAACIAGYVDYMSATTITSGKAVDLQFTHSLSALSFTIIVLDTENTTVSLALDGDISSAIVLDCDETIDSDYSILKVSYFVADGTDISSAFIKLDQNGSTTLLSISREDSNTLVAGKCYPFSYSAGDVPTGSGTESDPYIIYTATDMRKVGTDVDG